MMQDLKPGSIIKVQFKENLRYFRFIGYRRDFKKLRNLSVVNLNKDGRLLAAVPVGKTSSVVISDGVIPELIPFEGVVHLEVVDESQNKIFEDVL